MTQDQEEMPSSWTQIQTETLLDNQIKAVQIKPFFWNIQRKEWTWYKNLVIPTIEITFLNKQMEDFLDEEKQNLLSSKNQILLQPIQQECSASERTGQRIKITCWKLLKKDSTLEEVPLSGEVSQYTNQRNRVCFTGIKFGETTFWSRSSNFFLALTVEDSNSKTSSKTPVVCLFMSPPIFVRSRRKSSKKLGVLRINKMPSFSPYISKTKKDLPQNNTDDCLLQKTVCNSHSNENDLKEQDLKELLNYLVLGEKETIDHLEIILKFPNVVRAYIDTSMVCPASQDIVSALTSQSDKMKITMPVIFIYLNLPNTDFLEQENSQYSELVSQIQYLIKMKLSDTINYLDFPPKNSSNLIELCLSSKDRDILLNSSKETITLKLQRILKKYCHSTRTFGYQIEKCLCPISGTPNLSTEIQSQYICSPKKRGGFFFQTMLILNDSDAPNGQNSHFKEKINPDITQATQMKISNFREIEAKQIQVNSKQEFVEAKNCLNFPPKASLNKPEPITTEKNKIIKVTTPKTEKNHRISSLSNATFGLAVQSDEEAEKIRRNTYFSQTQTNEDPNILPYSQSQIPPQNTSTFSFQNPTNNFQNSNLLTVPPLPCFNHYISYNPWGAAAQPMNFFSPQQQSQQQQMSILSYPLNSNISQTNFSWQQLSDQ